MRVYSLILFALFSLFALTAAAHGSTLCDVNDDGVVDSADLLEIRVRNNRTVPPEDPKFDPNGDGRVNVADVRYCQLRQTSAADISACEMDDSPGVDRFDIQLIRLLIGSPVPSDGKGDVNGDGKITMIDVRQCTVSCTNPGCSPV